MGGASGSGGHRVDFLPPQQSQNSVLGGVALQQEQRWRRWVHSKDWPREEQTRGPGVCCGLSPSPFAQVECQLSDQPDGIPERAYLRMLLRPPTADGEVVNWSLGDRLANPLLWGMLKSRRRKECQITQKATDCSERAGKQAYQCLPSVAQTSA